MQAAQKHGHPEAILTLGQATIVFVVLAIVTADAVAILAVLGMLTLGEAAVILFAVLALAAGAMWTLLSVPQMSHRPDNVDSPKKLAEPSNE